MWAFKYNLRYYDEIHNNTVFEDGIVLGDSMSDVVKKLEKVYGEDAIEGIYDFEYVEEVYVDVIPREDLLSIVASLTKENSDVGV